MAFSELQNLLPKIVALAQQASQAILAIYNQTGELEINRKDDNTPLTAADLASHNILVEGLRKLTPDYPVLSEESAAIPFSERQQWQRYWLIDPLDGTKEFIHRTGEFSINIALIENHQAILGLLYVPVTQEYAYAIKGTGAFKVTAKGDKQSLRTRKVIHSQVKVIMSRRHGRSKFLSLVDKVGDYQIIDCGSALKFISLSMGEADLYPRFGLCSEWDTAAGQCILEEAGGKVINLNGDVLQYNTKDSLLNPEFIAVGDTKYNWLNMGELHVKTR